jgi:hypothetical protein
VIGIVLREAVVPLVRANINTVGSASRAFVSPRRTRSRYGSKYSYGATGKFRRKSATVRMSLK